MKSRKLSHESVSSFCRELSMLMRSGIMSGEALSIMTEDTDERSAVLFRLMSGSVEQGTSLSEVIRQSGVFPDYVSDMVLIGEKSGHIEDALLSLAQYYESLVQTSQQLRQAVLRPMTMVTMILLAIGIILVRVLPIFDDVYASIGGQLTGVAALALSFGDGLKRALPIMTAIVCFLIALTILVVTIRPVRNKILATARRYCYGKGLFLELAQARTAQCLAMCLGSGLGLDESLAFTAEAVKDMGKAKDRCTVAREQLEQGAPLQHAFLYARLFPAKQCRIAALAHRAGQVGDAMADVAAGLSDNATKKLQAIVNGVEPVLVTACSILIGGILVSVMLPLLGIMAAIG